MARPLSPLILTPEQRELIEAITCSRELPHSLTQRAGIILAADAGHSNKAISQDLQLCEDTVGFWRERWVYEYVDLEKWAGKPKQLRAAVISRLLADRPRPGCPGVFVCQLIAIACEAAPEYLSHWTQEELAQTLINRGIVETPSTSSVGHFLKSGGFETASRCFLLLVIDLVRSQQQVTPLFFSGHTPEMIMPRAVHDHHFLVKTAMIAVKK